MTVQHDTHYLTNKLDVRYVIIDQERNRLSKHSLYNPFNIDNTEEISPKGRTYQPYEDSLDLIPNSALCVKRNNEDFILLQNFEFINYYGEILIETTKKSNDIFIFLSDINTKQGCIKTRAIETINDIEEFPILALTTDLSCTIMNKLNNLIRCLKWI